MEKVKLYTKSYCPYCKASIALLEELKINFENFIVDEEENGEEEYSKIKEKTGQQTVPQIFIGDKFIGGNDKLQELHNSGELDKLLQDTN